MANWYIGSPEYTAVTQWSALSTVTVGTIVRQLAAPAVGSERCFRASAITTGITGAAEPTWTLTHNGTTTDSGVTWTECTGQAAFNGESGGSNFAAPHARLSNAFVSGWGAAGDVFAVASDHAATQSTALALNPPGSAASPCAILCISSTTNLTAPTPATTATESTTGASGISIGSIAASVNNYFYGITFNAGSGASTASIAIFTLGNSTELDAYFEQCTFSLTNTSTSSRISLCDQDSGFFLETRSCTFLFGSTSQAMIAYTGFNYLIGCSFAPSGSAPSSLLSLNSQRTPGKVLFRDCDLSKITGTLFSGMAQASSAIIEFQNCKLASAVTLTSGTSVSMGGPWFKLHNCDSASTNYRYYFANFCATVQQETTIVRTGGASDGTTPLSWNITSSSKPTYYTPFVSEEIVQWNDNSGSSKTATIFLTTNTTLNNNDMWLEVEYPSSASNPLGATVTTRMAVLGTPAALSSDTSTWGGSITNKYMLQVSFTPQMKGPVKARLYVAKPSVTIYVDPLLNIV